MKVIIAIVLVIMALSTLAMWCCLRVAAEADAQMGIQDSEDESG